MSDSDEYLEHKDWICNNPTQGEIRYIDDSDVITSDDTDAEGNNSRKLIKYNQLLPRGKAVYKLLRSTKPELNKTWRAANSTLDFLNKYKEGAIALSNRSRLNTFSSDDSVSDKLSYTDSTIGEKKNQSTYQLKSVAKSQNSTRSKGNGTWESVESTVVFQEKDTESGFKPVGLPKSLEKMAKSHKRKREASDSEEEKASHLKKIKANENKSVGKNVKRKENSHSFSESEDSGKNYSKTQRQDHKNVIKQNRNLLNTHLLSSESEVEAELSHNFHSNNENSEDDVSEKREESNGISKSVESSEEEVNHVKNKVIEPSTASETRKLYKTPKITHELKEEISKFSLLLDENLIENNDIWILQCPSSMDCTTLVNQRLSLGGSCQLNDGKRTYESYSYRNSQPRSATLAVPSEGNRLDLRTIPISGNIIVEESVKAANNARHNKIISESPSKVEFPENLRVRHPLLGIDFSKQPRTTERVAESLKKKKKHSKRHRESYNGSALDSLDSPAPSKKKKKVRDSNNEDVLMSDLPEQLLEESVNDSVVKKKKKKKHKDNDSFI